MRLVFQRQSLKLGVRQIARLGARLGVSALALMTLLPTPSHAQPKSGPLAALAGQGTEIGYSVDLENYPPGTLFVALRKETQGTGRQAMTNWTPTQVSFSPIARGDLDTEIIAMRRRMPESPSWAYNVVNVAYAAQARDLGTTGRPIDERGFDCGSVTQSFLRQTLSSQYNVCNSAFSKRDGFATSALLLLGGPAGVGTYKRYDRAALAEVVLNLNLMALYKRLSEQAGGSDTPLDPRNEMRTAVYANLHAQIDRAWLYNPRDPISATWLKATKSFANGNIAIDTAYNKAVSAGLPSTSAPTSSPNSAGSVFPIGPGNTTPELDAVMTASPSNRVPGVLAQMPPLFGLCDGSDWKLVSYNHIYRGDVTGRIMCRNGPALAGAGAGATGSGQRLAILPIAWTGEASDFYARWRASDNKLEAWVGEGTLIIANRSTSFVTVRSLAMHIGEDVKTISDGGNGLMIIPPSSQMKLSSGSEEAQELSRRLGMVISGNFTNSTPAALTGGPNDVLAAPVIQAGWSILYEVAGSPQTLSHIPNIKLEPKAP
jgi:hypothetical protein